MSLVVLFRNTMCQLHRRNGPYSDAESSSVNCKKSPCSTALCWTLAFVSVSWPYTQSAGLLGRGISPSHGLCLHTGHHKEGLKYTRISMSRVELEPRTPVSWWAKTVHVSDRAAAGIGLHFIRNSKTLSLVPVTSQVNQIHIVKQYLSKINFNVVLSRRSPKRFRLAAKPLAYC
jgi:hypothetical protein